MFNRAVRAGIGNGGSPPSDANPQSSPVTMTLGVDRSGALKVDRAIRVGNRILVAGWRTGEIPVAARNRAGSVTDTIVVTPRPDVAEHYGITSAERLGFVLVGPPGPDGIELLCGDAGHQVVHPIAVEPAGPLDANACALMMPALAWLASTMTPFSEEWVELIALIPAGAAADAQVTGVLDEVAASANVRCAIASGWVSAPPSAVVWLQDSNGVVHGLGNAFRMHRDDVRSALSRTSSVLVQQKPGFCLHLAGIEPGTRIYLKALHESVVHLMAEAVVTAMPMDPVESSRLLFSIPGVSTARMIERMETVEGPVLDALIAAHRAEWDELPVREQILGQPVHAPKVSIIVPLFGRADFVEHQLIEFEKDPWLLQNAELVYVIDDRSLVERFTAEAHALHRLYRVPFRWLWGGINRGFAGANNLGADHSTAPTLLFMNSDVFPQSSGWLAPMLEVLERRSDIGAVGPRLVFADGSIQHAGMEFRHRDDLGIWTNHHPLMGLDPALDPRSGVCEVPAVTGACMAIRREDFDRVGGWDTGYLIGDFEDSDLCLKLLGEGLKSAYLPDVQLTHLERQSLRLVGQGDFRSKVVMYNALRHQRRWLDLLCASAKQGAQA